MNTSTFKLFCPANIIRPNIIYEQNSLVIKLVDISTNTITADVLKQVPENNLKYRKLDFFRFAATQYQPYL